MTMIAIMMLKMMKTINKDKKTRKTAISPRIEDTGDVNISSGSGGGKGKKNRENSGIGTVNPQFIGTLTQTRLLGLDARGNTFNKWQLLWTDNLLGIPLIYCICGDVDDESTSIFGGAHGIDTLIDDVIGDDGTDGKSKTRNIYAANIHYRDYYRPQTIVAGLGADATV